MPSGRNGVEVRVHEERLLAGGCPGIGGVMGVGGQTQSAARGGDSAGGGRPGGVEGATVRRRCWRRTKMASRRRARLRQVAGGGQEAGAEMR